MQSLFGQCPNRLLNFSTGASLRAPSVLINRVSVVFLDVKAQSREKCTRYEYGPAYLVISEEAEAENYQCMPDSSLTAATHC